MESHKILSKPTNQFWMLLDVTKTTKKLITVVPQFHHFHHAAPRNSGRGFFKPADQLPTGLGCRFVVQKPFSNGISQSFPWGFEHRSCELLKEHVIPQRVMHDQIPRIFSSKHQLVVGSKRVAVGSWIHGVNFILAKTPWSTGKNGLAAQLHLGR